MQGLLWSLVLSSSLGPVVRKTMVVKMSFRRNIKTENNREDNKNKV